MPTGALALLFRVRVPKALAYGLGGLGILAVVARCWILPVEGWDFLVFWDAGEDIWLGRDPYCVRADHPTPLNPPPALPLFALFAALPRVASLAIWTAFNVTASLVLVWLADRTFQAQEGLAHWNLPRAQLAVLTGIFAFSYANRMCIDAGQLALLAALALVGALYSQARQHHFVAGALLAIASFKTSTMLPFLLLLRHKSDLKSWFSMGVVGAALALVCLSPSELITSCRECLA